MENQGFTNYRQMTTMLSNLSEEELRNHINFEISTYKRKIFICRMHQRYSKLRTARERRELLDGGMLL